VFYIPEDAILHSDRHENLKSYKAGAQVWVHAVYTDSHSTLTKTTLVSTACMHVSARMRCTRRANIMRGVIRGTEQGYEGSRPVTHVYVCPSDTNEPQ
jgi:hypothetical protein